MSKSTKSSREDSWQRLVFYGEAFGFVVAWIVGLVMLVQAANSADEVTDIPRIDSFAGANLDSGETSPLK